MTIGVLALQGDFAEHINILKALKAPAKEIRCLEDLAQSDRLIIPGGESTTIGRLLIKFKLYDEIIKRNKANTLPLFGTCAGAILLSKKITDDDNVKPLGLLDITIKRNAYGTQLQSFSDIVPVKGISTSVQASFIRAPVIQRTGKHVEILAVYNNNPVMVRQNSILAATFHPEVTGQKEIHELFLSI